MTDGELPRPGSLPHSVLGAAAATVLTAHAEDDYAFSTTSGSLPGPSRSFRSVQSIPLVAGFEIRF